VRARTILGHSAINRGKLLQIRIRGTKASSIALAAFTTMLFLFALGGTWFAYYLRQEGLQMSHFTLIALAVGTAVARNLPAV
jgi:hypothetical protein